MNACTHTHSYTQKAFFFPSRETGAEMQIEFPSIFSLSSFCTLSFYSFLIIYRQLFFLIPSFFAPSHSDSSCSPSTFPCISHSLLFCLSFPFVSKNPTSSPPPHHHHLFHFFDRSNNIFPFFLFIQKTSFLFHFCLSSADFPLPPFSPADDSRFNLSYLFTARNCTTIR